jgi:hypothetical protein
MLRRLSINVDFCSGKARAIQRFLVLPGFADGARCVSFVNFFGSIIYRTRSVRLSAPASRGERLQLSRRIADLPALQFANRLLEARVAPQKSKLDR